MNHLAVFENAHHIRRTMHDSEVHFSVVDAIGAVVGNGDPSDYWTTMKRREAAEARKAGGEPQLPTVCRRLKLEAPDGKMRLADCATLEGIFRILQSVPSPKVEPFKRWLAQVGRERIEEERNPALAVERARKTWHRRGRDDKWIARRLEGITTRINLTGEWQARGADGKDYGILTNVLTERTFGVTPKNYKAFKGLKPTQNLRDNLDIVELALNSLAEATALRIHEINDSQGFKQLHRDVMQAGAATEKARLAIESATGRPVLNPGNGLLPPPKMPAMRIAQT